jgi:hypothetical protein
MVFRMGRSLSGAAGRAAGFLLAIVCGSLAPAGVRAQSPAAGLSVDQLLQMSAGEIEQVYRQGTVAAIPPGRVRGTAILAPGTRRTRMLARGTRLVWQGKVIGTDGTSAVNRFFGMKIIRGQLTQGSSWLDGAPTLLLDYSQTSRIYANKRDEIRQIGPGLFLGLMYDRTTSPVTLQMYFTLETPA